MNLDNCFGVVLIHDKSTDEIFGAYSLNKHTIKGIKKCIDRNYATGEFVVIKGSSPVKVFFEGYIDRKVRYEHSLFVQMDFCRKNELWVALDLYKAKMKKLRNVRS